MVYNSNVANKLSAAMPVVITASLRVILTFKIASAQKEKETCCDFIRLGIHLVLHDMNFVYARRIQ